MNRLSTFALVTCLLSTRSLAQVEARPEPAAASVATPAAPGPATVFYLRDGRIVRGQVLDRDSGTITVRDERTGTTVRFEESSVRHRDGPPLPPICEPGDGRTVDLQLVDGRKVSGQLTRRCEDRIVLIGADGARIEVRDDELSRGAGALPGPPLDPAKAPWPPDVLRSRTLATPTAVAPLKGEIVLANSGLTLGAEGGLLDHLSLGVAITPPVLYAENYGLSGMATLAGGLPLGPVHLRAGLQLRLSTTGGTVLYAFGAATVEVARVQLTVYAGPPLPGAVDAGKFGDRILALGAAWRVASWAALVGEGWLGLDGPNDVAAGAAFRILVDPLAVELGAVFIPNDPKIVPWLALGWRARGGP